MRSKPVQWLAATALAVTCTVPVWAQPEVVGEEIRVNQNNDTRQLQPVAVFNQNGNALIVWENDRHGILGRAYDRTGKPLTAELSLVPNQNLPGIPAQGQVIARKDPAVVFLPSGEFFLFWTEQKAHLVVDHFYERREIQDWDVLGQRFDASGVPVSERIRVHPATAGFQAKPRAVRRGGDVLVVWESGPHHKAATSVHARLFTRRGRAMTDEIVVHAGSEEIWNSAVAANASGDFLVVWEGADADRNGIQARLYDRSVTPAGPAFGVNGATLGRQRRPAVAAGKGNDFLVAWQSYTTGGAVHGIYGQFISPTGQRLGSELQFSKGVGEVQISPALALLPSGHFVVTWMDWLNTTPIGVFAVEIDGAGRRIGNEMKISDERLFPQYRISVAANIHGDILSTWEGRIERARAITARRLVSE